MWRLSTSNCNRRSLGTDPLKHSCSPKLALLSLSQTSRLGKIHARIMLLGGAQRHMLGSLRHPLCYGSVRWPVLLRTVNRRAIPFAKSYNIIMRLCLLIVLKTILGVRIIEFDYMTATHVIWTIYTVISKAEVSGGQYTWGSQRCLSRWCTPC